MEEPWSSSSDNNKGEQLVDLPPGFRFHPTDEEIITFYLTEKVMSRKFSAAAIGEVDLNKCEPWDLHEKAKMGEKEWYFFCQKDRKYPTGMRTNRATESGYWKATGKDKEILRGKGFLVGMKKTLVFYKGRAPKGEKTNWVMHEYRLEGNLPFPNLNRFAKDEWVVCRIYHKPLGSAKKRPIDEHMVNSFHDNIGSLLEFSSLPRLIDPSSSSRPGPSFTPGHPPEFKYASPAQPPPQPTTANQYFKAPMMHQNPQTPNFQNAIEAGISLINVSGFEEMGPKVDPMPSTQAVLSVDANYYNITGDVHKNGFAGISKSYEDFADFLGNIWDC